MLLLLTYMRPIQLRTGWHNLPFELQAMILDRTIELIARPTSTSPWQENIFERRQHLAKATSRTKLMQRWREMFSLCIAIPWDMRPHIQDSLDRHTRKAWLRCDAGREAEKLGLHEAGKVPTEEDEMRWQISQREYINYLALWRLMKMRSKRRKNFWEGFDDLVVYRRQPFYIAQEY